MPVQVNTQSFIVRIWYEEAEGTDPALVQRGSIEHVTSRRRRFFQDPVEMLVFIDEHVREGIWSEAHEARGRSAQGRD